MKKYTHAWLAMMAMKRIEKANIPEKQKEDAEALIKWFKDYRDFVISGAWYPDEVICDMSSSHICKYYSDETSRDTSFRRMHPTLRMYSEFEDAPRRQKPFSIKTGNLCDRCESFAESLIDSFKILYSESQGSPITPSCNHIALRFFILSHYIADAHMPLHCDARSFTNDNEVHAFIEDQWDQQVKASYEIDDANNRFFYDKYGYPLKKEITPLCQYVEDELVSREFSWAWSPEYKDPSNPDKKRKDASNTWDYMSGITQCSYVMGGLLVPEGEDVPLGSDGKPMPTSYYKTIPAFTEHFNEYSKIILADAVESIAKIWLHAWVRYRDWWRGRELAAVKEKSSAAEKARKKAQDAIDSASETAASLKKKVRDAETTLKAKQADFDACVAASKSTTKAQKSLTSAETALEKAKLNLQTHYDTIASYEKVIDILTATAKAAKEEYNAKLKYNKQFEDKNSTL